MKLEILAALPSNEFSPYFPIPIPAGPGAAIEQEHDLVEKINIDKWIREGRDHLIYTKVYGLSMRSRSESNIDDGDILAVQRTGFAEPGDVVIAEVNDEFTIKRLRHHAHGLYLVPANDAYPIRKVERSDSFSVWGIVVARVHKFKRAA